MTLYRCPILNCDKEAYSTEKRFVFYHIKHHYLSEIYRTAIIKGIAHPDQIPKYVLVNLLINDAKISSSRFYN